MPTIHRRRLRFTLFWGLLALPLAACSTPTANRSEPVISPARVTVIGDWDDINAVIAGVLPIYKLVESEVPDQDSDLRRFRLDTLDRGPGSLTFRRLEDDQIEISAAIGRFARPVDEVQLVDALADRFTQLRGDVAAPLRRPRSPR